MKQLELALVPTPGAKPEFLAEVIPLPKDAAEKAVIPALWQSMTEHNKAVVLEGYTRESWAENDVTSVVKWQNMHVRSVDGKNKVPGFVQYLQERQKTAFGRFLCATGTTTVTTFVLVVSYKQTNAATLSCRIAPLFTISNCPLKPKSGDQKVLQQQHQKPPAAISVPKAGDAAAAPKRKGFGLLGNLVGAQKRTNQHVVSSVVAKPGRAPSSAASATASNPSEGVGIVAHTSHDIEAQQELKTSGEVLADFRNKMEQAMLDFDIAPEVSMKVPIKLSDYTKQVHEADQGKVTMEVLKYIVYEQAEEVNDEWIAHKEPSEFMDEITIAIYKDAEDAPPEVLEELNRAELPEEMKAQQKMVAEQRRQQEMKALREQEQKQLEALKSMATGSGEDGDEDVDLAALNTQKRDRRTIEEIQRDNAKRQRLD
ncbi:hypothetical protein IV203_029376 [Nitzschia inconspicua]|uniref:Uncharacterized protein n=1 Tax=Nitzschia inconspicua TaxID=303405 RepID=A0A9K3LU67_9STRA|nr:hypothetical protein IV203_029376 [Nitzschia inconspicua]